MTLCLLSYPSFVIDLSRSTQQKWQVDDLDLLNPAFQKGTFLIDAQLIFRFLFHSLSLHIANFNTLLPIIRVFATLMYVLLSTLSLSLSLYLSIYLSLYLSISLSLSLSLPIYLLINLSYLHLCYIVIDMWYISFSPIPSPAWNR